MDLKNPPPSLKSSVATARHFYQKKDAMPLYDHCHRVYQRAAREIFDSSEAHTPDEGRKSRWFNGTIADITLYHVVEPSKLAENPQEIAFLKPGHPLFDPDLRRELGVFSALTQLDRIQESVDQYPALINHGPAPLALLARLADYAVTHDTEDRTPGHISHHQSPIFRMYSSKDNAKRCLENEALAGERIYAPVAERFGFPILAGDILKHAYRINHTLIHDHVMGLMAFERSEGRLRLTQSIVRRLRKAIRTTFTDSGFDVSVVPRMEKHEGKMMRKFFKNLVERHSKEPAEKRPPLEDFIAAHIGEYSLSSINDPVALKVILHRFNGKAIDDLPEPQKIEVIRIALHLATVQLRILRMIEGYTYKYTVMDKSNGYKAHHFDARPHARGNALPIELQLKTRMWDDIASHGKAAHYYYLGGDPAFIENIGRAYHDILYRSENGRGGLRSIPPPPR